MKRKPLEWPPKVGARICLDTGYGWTSWSGEVRAIVDDDYAVVRKYLQAKSRSVYVILDRIEVEVFNSNERSGVRYFDGPLRKSTIETRLR